jgi:RNA polymerase sigma factor (sigma-70 family)
MTDSDASRDFHARLNEGTESAAEELDLRYRQLLCELAGRELGRRFAAREDPEDVVQSAMASFYRGVKEKRFQIDHSGALWRLLETITRNKVRKHVEHHRTIKRDMTKEVHSDGIAVPSKEPTAEEAVCAADLIEQIIKGLTPADAEMFRLRLEGHTIPEIAKHFGVTEAAIRCKLEWVRYLIDKLQGDDEARETIS